MKLTLKILRYLAVYFVALVLLVFAVTKFLDTQFQVWRSTEYMPLKDISLFWQAWAFFGRSYAYGVFLGIAELLAGLFLLFDRTRLAGLLLALGIFLNVVIIDFEFRIYGPLIHAALELFLVIALLTGYVKDLKKFFWDMGGRFDSARKAAGKWSIIIPTLFATLVLAITTYLIKQAEADATDGLMGAYEITHFSIGSDTIPTSRGKYTDRPMVFFEFGKSVVFSLDNTVSNGGYAITGDSLTINIPGGVHNIYALTGTVNRQQSIINGVADQKPVVLKLKRIDDE
jgi:hypothetical protein